MLRKTCLFLFLTLAVSLSAAAQSDGNAIDKFFQGYVNDNRFSVVYISPKLFQLVGNLDFGNLDLESEAEAKALKEMLLDMRGLRILSADENGRQFYKEAKSRINTQEYEPLMTVREKDGDNVDFLIRQGANGKIAELLLLTGGETNFTLLSFIGNLDLDKILKLAKEIDEE